MGTTAVAATDGVGDIVSQYPYLVGPFAALQIIGWLLALLELGHVVGPVGYAAQDALFPIDIAFCQMMFWGTLHHGPISDGRLALICRIAFVVEGIVVVTSSLAIFRPTSVADALAALNGTSVFDLPSLTFNYALGAFWFVVFVPFSAYVGTTVLQVGRRRLIENTPETSLAPFSSNFLRFYVIILALQLTIVGVTVALTAGAEGVEAEVLQSKLNYALRALSLVLAQLLGWKAIIFNAAGHTLSEFWAGRAPKTTYAAVLCAVLYVAMVLADLISLAIANDSTDPILIYHTVYAVGLENVPMFGVWLCAAPAFDITIIEFFLPVSTTEKRRQRRKDNKVAGKQVGAVQLEVQQEGVRV
jgi:hypothetical protein